METEDQGETPAHSQFEPTLGWAKNLKKKKKIRGAREMAYRQRTLAALAEDQDSILSLRMVGHNHLNLQVLGIQYPLLLI